MFDHLSKVRNLRSQSVTEKYLASCYRYLEMEDAVAIAGKELFKEEYSNLWH